MSIKRFVSQKDTAITNAFKSNLLTRASGSNMGDADVLDVFSIYGQASSASVETSRILMQFDTDSILAQRNSLKLPASGNVSFYLKMQNAVHAFTLPRKFYLEVQAVSSSWTEGRGLDTISYDDEGVANWISSSDGNAWTTPGGDFLSTPVFNQYFDIGNENLELDITDLAEAWLDGTLVNNGLVVKLSSSLESDTNSYYTKQFYARGSEFELRRPVIEARWDSSLQDQRNKFYFSSSLTSNNNNKLVLYNRFRGNFENIPSIGTGSIYVSLYSGSNGPSGSALVLSDGSTVATGSWSSLGHYTANLSLPSGNYETVHDVWFSGSQQFYTGSITPIEPSTEPFYPTDEWVSKIVNLKSSYMKHEEPTLRVFIRPKNWCPTIYTKATATPESSIIENSFYKVVRTADNLEVIPYGTGSLSHTKLSYDDQGNYFQLDMSLFEVDYMYEIKLAYETGNGYEEQPESFKFRLERHDSQ